MDKRYVRNYFVEGVDIEGQEKISSTTAIVFGLGGLGSNLCFHLTAMGFKKIILVDKDIVSISNLQRQILYTEESVSKNKTDEANKRLSALNSEIEIKTITSFDIEKVLNENKAEIIFDCTDNYKSRLLINQTAKIKNIPVCSASAIQWEGWLCLFDHVSDKFSFQKIFEEKDNYKNCSEDGILSPVVGVVASMQALEGIRYLLNLDYAKNTMILINSYLNETKKISFN